MARITAILYLMILACALMGLMGCDRRGEPVPADQSIRPARVFVVSEADNVKDYHFVGRVAPARSVDMTFEVSGPLRELAVLEGQTISAGSLVAALDTKDFELAVREAQVQLQLARQDLERKRSVLAQRGIARSVVDDAQSNFELQQVRLQQARESLADARLYAPFDAFVARRYVDNFVTIQAGEKIVRLNDPNRLLVMANVPENLFATATSEQVVDMYAEFDFAPDVRFPLQQYEASGEADQVAQTYAVSLQMPRPQDYNVLPGMTATVTVRLRESDTADALQIVPTSALVGDAKDGFYVWIVDPQTLKVSRREVQLGEPRNVGVPVKSGLDGGEMIVATGASQLVEGMQIRLLGEPAQQL